MSQRRAGSRRDESHGRVAAVQLCQPLRAEVCLDLVRGGAVAEEGQRPRGNMPLLREQHDDGPLDQLEPQRFEAPAAGLGSGHERRRGSDDGGVRLDRQLRNGSHAEKEDPRGEREAEGEHHDEKA